MSDGISFFSNDDLTENVKKVMSQTNYTEDEVKEKAKAPVKNKFSNTFIRLGKICEFNIIQKLPNKNIEIINSILFGENNIGKSMDFFDDLDFHLANCWLILKR